MTRAVISREEQHTVVFCAYCESGMSVPANDIPDEPKCKGCRRRERHRRIREKNQEKLREASARADDLQENTAELTSDEAFAYVLIDKKAESTGAVATWMGTHPHDVAVEVVTARRKLNGAEGQ